MTLDKVCIVGSGNWGSAISKIIGNNITRFPNIFHPTVSMWVYEENFEGRLLSEWINTFHVNQKYLPGITLPNNVHAYPDLLESVKGASLLVFVLPHQFIKNACESIKGHLAHGARGISLIKGVDSSPKDGLILVSNLISQILSIDVSVLMGANIANEVAQEMFCEATIGYKNKENADRFKLLFDTPHFRINCVRDVEGIELCGALKNIVAIAAGIVDGLDLGENTKAAIIRIGLAEMKRFIDLFAPINGSERWETFFESCGVADLITTCFGGRNRKLAEAHVRTGKSFDNLEMEMLNGQKLQGTSTSKEIYHILCEKNAIDSFPLFVSVYRICYKDMKPKELINSLGEYNTVKQ